jgi:hypothetical protein
VAGGAPALDRLWHALDEPAAAQVLAAVAAATGWLPALRPPRQGAVHDAQKERIHARTLPEATALQALIGRPGQPAPDARTRLAALLAWWMHAPARLQAPDAAEALQAAAVHLAPGGASPAREAAPRRRQDHDLGVAPQAPSTSPEAAQGEPDLRSIEPIMAMPDLARAPGASLSVPSPDRQARAEPAISVPTDLRVEPKPESFFTRHGGLFWLIQVLALPPFQQRLARLDEPQAAWREWIRLVQALGAEPDDAWWAFAAQRSLLADHDPQAVRHLRWPAEVAGALIDAALQRFGQAALQAAIAERPARVVADEVRVEVHFRLADAQLEVRRAGLDVDPGWVPWLGCVLRWHFGSALAPQGEGSR